MVCSFDLSLKVPFHDLDALQMVWHGNYLKYFDQARFELFADAGVDLYRYMQEKDYIFPITRTAVKHIAPLRAGDTFVCRATVVEADYKITMTFELRREADQTICARGRSEQVAVKLPEMELEYEIPSDIRHALGFEG